MEMDVLSKEGPFRAQSSAPRCATALPCGWCHTAAGSRHDGSPRGVPTCGGISAPHTERKHSGGAKRAVPRGCHAGSAIPKEVSGHTGMAHGAALGSALPHSWHVPCAPRGCGPFVGSHGHPLPHSIAWHRASTWDAARAHQHGLSTQRFGSVPSGDVGAARGWSRGRGGRAALCHHPRATIIPVPPSSLCHHHLRGTCLQRCQGPHPRCHGVPRGGKGPPRHPRVLQSPVQPRPALLPDAEDGA